MSAEHLILHTMFIRRAETLVTDAGETCFTHRLVKSEQIGNKVRQITLLNLGRHSGVSLADLPALCRRIGDLLSGHLSFSGDLSADLEQRARNIADQLLARQRVGMSKEAEKPEYTAVHVKSPELMRPRSVGVGHVGLRAISPNAAHPENYRKSTSPSWGPGACTAPRMP